MIELHQCERKVAKNKKLLASLREDVNSAELMALTLKDAKLNRMTMPVPIDQIDLSNIVVVGTSIVAL